MQLLNASPGNPDSGPVFLACSSRSGSTLLRFLLNTHPELACPAESNLCSLYANLTGVLSTLAGGSFPVAPIGQVLESVPAGVLDRTREVIDLVIGDYLRAQGKSRYCDKSLDTLRYAEIITRVHPAAKFIVLYRHPMDVIASALEACPWGLGGYGFDPYIAETPNNAILAAARYWLSYAQEAMAFQGRHPDRCHLVFYENLVADPEAEASAIFGFLGLKESPGISEACFGQPQDRAGAADFKIWHTDEVSAASVGRGWEIPADLIAPDVLSRINNLLQSLGYLTVDDDWGTSSPPLALRQSGPGSVDAIRARAELSTESVAAAGDDRAEPVEIFSTNAWLGNRIERYTGLARAGVQRDFPTSAVEKFCIVALPDAEYSRTDVWLVDLASGTVTEAADGQESSTWDVVGSREVWERICRNRLNLGVAMRSSALRYADSGDSDASLIDIRLTILKKCLGLTR